MTNTGDFRRYSYSGDTSYLINSFDVGRSSAAPAYKPEPERNLKVRENAKRKSKISFYRNSESDLAELW